MSRPKLLGQTTIPGSNRQLKLLQGKDDCSIVISGAGELMSTRRHGSEDALGRLPCEMLNHTESATVLIGGLGMGFTLAAALAAVGDSARVIVAELVPAVIEWNQGPLGAHAGFPLNDPRTRVYQGDVSDLLRDRQQQFDVIALDVDNGPEALSTSGNNWLYSIDGIRSVSNKLKAGGVLAYWSTGPDQKFSNRLRQCGLVVKEKNVFAHGNKGAKHTIWLAQAR